MANALACLAIAISRTMQFNERCPWRSLRSRIPNSISRTLSRRWLGLCKTQFEGKIRKSCATSWQVQIYCSKGINGKKSWVEICWRRNGKMDSLSAWEVRDRGRGCCSRRWCWRCWRAAPRSSSALPSSGSPGTGSSASEFASPCNRRSRILQHKVSALTRFGRGL